MAEYLFSPREQDAIRELGRAGFRYERETKKTIEFVHDASGQVINLNREHGSLALVFGFGDVTKVHGVPGISVTGTRSSSNFSRLATGPTRTGKNNHQGIQLSLVDRDAIAIAIERMGGGIL
ncbi:MAG: hypothetical protein KDJ86_17320 [Bauldia sp.]|uniref:hypothetical protein n=1 Tax=Bauldia sp. TaxID=2575872 RepID=UPI001D365015|nr:hypothetical protein [Bauldia sp.]MCB1497544.1 hypothetical protein [Bauldia sp.]